MCLIINRPGWDEMFEYNSVERKISESWYYYAEIRIRKLKKIT